MSAQQQLIDQLINSPQLWDCSTTTPSQVHVIETHGSTVLLGAVYALKFKKPVTFDHMDYGTAAKRLACLKKELHVNTKMAAPLYIGVEYVYLDNGKLICSTVDHENAEAFLKMKRFADENRLDHFTAQHGFSDILGEELCDIIVQFHQKADAIKDRSKVPDFEKVIAANFDQLYDHCPKLFSVKEVDQFRRQLLTELENIKETLEDRVVAGWIRFGHGDLHLQNICLLQDKPVPFDAIEYEDNFVIGDVFYDLSFLLMDLNSRGYNKTGNQIFNRYIRKMGWQLQEDHLNILKCLPFFMTMRSGIRTHVAASRFSQTADESQKAQFADQARANFKASCQYLKHEQPIALAIGGYSGSGKSTIAAHVATKITPSPGALRIRSDEIRRQLIDWDDYSPMPQSAYTPEISQTVYAKMIQIAKTAIGFGQSVILDAVLDRETDRNLFKSELQSTGAKFLGFWLQVDIAEMEKRISSRTRDASDATVEILHMQLKKQPEIHTDWIKINANGSIAENTASLLKFVK